MPLSAVFSDLPIFVRVMIIEIVLRLLLNITPWFDDFAKHIKYNKTISQTNRKDVEVLTFMDKIFHHEYVVYLASALKALATYKGTRMLAFASYLRAILWVLRMNSNGNNGSERAEQVI